MCDCDEQLACYLCEKFRDGATLLNLSTTSKQAARSVIIVIYLSVYLTLNLGKYETPSVDWLGREVASRELAGRFLEGLKCEIVDGEDIEMVVCRRMQMRRCFSFSELAQICSAIGTADGCGGSHKEEGEGVREGLTHSFIWTAFLQVRVHCSSLRWRRLFLGVFQELRENYAGQGAYIL